MFTGNAVVSAHASADVMGAKESICRAREKQRVGEVEVSDLGGGREGADGAARGSVEHNELRGGSGGNEGV